MPKKSQPRKKPSKPQKARLANGSQHTLPTPSWQFVSRSWQLVVEHPFSLLWLVLIPAVLSAVGRSLLPQTTPEVTTTVSQQWSNSVGVYVDHPAAIALSAVAGLWILLVLPATVVMGSQVVRGAGDDPVKFLRDSWHYFWRVYGLNILVAIVIILGFIALIVPGLIFLRRYLLAQYYLVSQDLSIREAMRVSAAETKPVSGYIWGTIGVLVVFSFLSSLALNAPWLGPLAGPLVGLVYYFGLALRQREIAGQ